MKSLLGLRKHNHPVMTAAAVYFGIVFGVGFFLVRCGCRFWFRSLVCALLSSRNCH